MAATEATTVALAFQATATAFAGRRALRSMDGTTDWTWAEYSDHVRRAAAGLSAIGLCRGDTMACWLSNRPEFHVVDTAAIHLGAASFSVYPTYTVEQAEHVIRDSGARVLVAEQATAESALAVRAGGRTALETIIVVDEASHGDLTSWAEMLAGARQDFDLAESLAAVEASDLVTMIYTSGTTGAPKGVQLTHGNVMAQLAAVSERLGLPEGISAVSWLPMAHVAERLSTHYFPIVRGWSVTTCDQPGEIAAVVAETRPEFFFSPPRLWEKLRSGVLSRSAGVVPSGDTAKAALQDLGFDRIRVAIVGAAPCPREVIEFWHGLGIPLNEVYGLSETTGVATINPPSAIRIGTAGTRLDGVEMKLSPEGEILIRGPVVMTGYRHLPDLTAEAIDADGWLHSGDVGVFDDDDYLRIVDRIKEIIINAAGKNMSPANIELAIKSGTPLIGQVVCVGDGRPFNTALIVLDADYALQWAQQESTDADTLEQLATEPKLIAAVQAGVHKGNQRLARVEQIKKFTILSVDWIPGGDELTPTMKLKRRPIAEKYAAEIERMYAD
jgi:long-chain acyl-CoA synthetase